MDLTLVSCNFNTPNLILNLLKSLKLTSSEIPKVLIINTSTIEECELTLKENAIPYYNAKGYSHGDAVNIAFEKIKTRYILLVDSDVLFLKDFKPVFEKFKSSGLTLMGKVVGDCAGKFLYPRVEPWYCFMDLEQLKYHNITFFDTDKTKKSKNTDRVYDVGSTMFEDVTNKDLLIGDVDLENNYFKHYGGMSWRMQRYNPDDVDTDIDFGGTHPHKQLWDIGMRVKHQYDQDVVYLNDITIKNIFK